MDKFPDWSVFQERELIAPTSELLSPASEIATALRATYVTQARTQQVSQDIEHNHFVELAQQAVLATQLGMLLERNQDVFLTSSEHMSPLYRTYKSLQIIHKQMLDVLKKAGLEIEIPLHKTYAEVANSVEIEHWRHHQDITEEIVIEVLEPVVRKGTLLRAGRVVMGAPLHGPSADEQDVRKDQINDQTTYQ